MLAYLARLINHSPSKLNIDTLMDIGHYELKDLVLECCTRDPSILSFCFLLLLNPEVEKQSLKKKIDSKIYPGQK